FIGIAYFEFRILNFEFYLYLAPISTLIVSPVMQPLLFVLNSIFSNLLTFLSFIFSSLIHTCSNVSEYCPAFLGLTLLSITGVFRSPSFRYILKSAAYFCLSTTFKSIAINSLSVILGHKGASITSPPPPPPPSCISALSTTIWVYETRFGSLLIFSVTVYVPSFSYTCEG